MTALWRLALLAAIAVIGWVALSQRAPAPWTDDEKTVLRSLWLDSLPPLPEDRSNAVADDLEAAHFGHALFFDRRLSANGAIACSTCHRPERRFADGLAKGQAIGISARNTPSVVATAYSPWLYWGCTGTVAATASGHRPCRRSKIRANMAATAARWSAWLRQTPTTGSAMSEFSVRRLISRR
jgi:cytochrome c peroxidase